jgi:TRAP-type C4-dicarboxylate transport system permease small subunit
MDERGGGIWMRIEAFIERISSVTGFVGGLAILVAAFVVTEGVVTRKVFGASAIWQIELSVFLLIYACFVGAAFGQKNEHHLNVDLAIVYLQPKTREIILLIMAVFSSVICFILAVFAWPMWWNALVRNEHSESLWGPPLWIPYLFLPLGASLLFLQYLVNIVRKSRALKRGAYRTEAIRTELKEVPIATAGEDGEPESPPPPYPSPVKGEGTS